MGPAHPKKQITDFHREQLHLPHALIEELYAEPEPENSGETAEGTESKESEGAELSAESGAAE